MAGPSVAENYKPNRRPIVAKDFGSALACTAHRAVRRARVFGVRSKTRSVRESGLRLVFAGQIFLRLHLDQAAFGPFESNLKALPA